MIKMDRYTCRGSSLISTTCEKFFINGLGLIWAGVL